MQLRKGKIILEITYNATIYKDFHKLSIVIVANSGKLSPLCSLLCAPQTQKSERVLLLV